MNISKIINSFLSSPVKVVVLDPRTSTPRHTFVYLGDVPKNVADAAKKLNGRITRDVESVLKSFYGSDWRKKLAVDILEHPAKILKLGGDEPFDDVSSLPETEVAINDDYGNSPLTLGGADDIEISLEELSLEPDNVKPGGKRKKGNEMGSGMTGIKGMNIGDIEISDEDLALGPSRVQRVSIGEDISLRLTFEPGVTYDTSTHVYPEDKFSELKDKIFVSTGIPNYRQHVFWYVGNRLQTPYRIYAEGVYAVDIMSTFASAGSSSDGQSTQPSQPSQTLFGLPIDKNLYVMRDEVKIEAMDTFRTLGDTPFHDNTIYVVDIDQFVDPVRSQLNEILSDTYQFDLVYFGFCIKFWPQFTKECFHDYVANEKELYQKFPDFAKSVSYLTTLENTEKSIIDRNYKMINKVLDIVNSSRSTINLAITHLTATTIWEKNIVNLRNLFDKLRVSKCIPEVYAYVEHEGKKFLLRKRYSRNESDINFPPAFKTGLIIAISLRRGDQETFHKKNSAETTESEQSRYLFVNIRANGRYYVKSIWNEEDEYNFEDIITVMKKFVDPLINQINSMGKYVFPIDKPLPIMTRNNIQYDNLSISLYWKKILSSSMFKFVKTLFEEYIYGGVVSVKGLQQLGQFELVFRKGMTEFDPNQIERVISMANIETVSNHYAYLSNNTVKQKWDQLYDGRVIKLHHRTTDLKFEIINIKEKEFQILFQYLSVFIYRAMCNEKLKTLSVRPAGDVKKLRKLKEIDPELYNLKKYGSKKVYSIICQNPNQPVVYTEDEIRSMSAEARKRLVKYWNFTLNRETFYGCPNKRYPHLSFKVGVHPKGYCLPCCKKSSSAPESKKAKVNEICLKKHFWSEEGSVTTEETEGVSRHIINYGKDLDLGRLSKLPQTSMISLLANTLEHPHLNYYLYGVAQNFPAVEASGLLYSAAEALTISPVELVKKCIDYVKKGGDAIFTSLLNGAIAEHFVSPKVFLNVLNDIFVMQKQFVPGHRFTQWEDFFSEMLMIIYDIFVFAFVDETGKGEFTYLYVGERARQLVVQQAQQSNSRYLLVVKRASNVYPVFVINTETYFKNLSVEKRLFVQKDTAIRHIFSIITSNYEKTMQSKAGRQIDLPILREFANGKKYRIVYKYVNKRNMCYGVLIDGPDGNVYVPIEYVVNIPDGLAVDQNVYSGEKYPVKTSSLTAFISAINAFISARHKNYSPIVLKFTLKREGKTVGYRAEDNPAIYYVSAEDKPLAETASRELLYDFNEINTAIMTRSPPIDDNRKRYIGKSLHENYLYQLFMLEFINYTEKERNTSVRDKIREVLSKVDFRKKVFEAQRELRALLKNFPSDVATLQSQISTAFYSGDRKGLFDTINNTVYEFDKITVNRLRQLDHSGMIEELRKITKEFTVEGVVSEDVSIPNVYLPCEYAGVDAKYCKGRKLIIDGKTLESFIDILSSDLTNPIKYKYITSGLFTDNLIDYFQFETYPEEIITVVKM